MNNNRQLETGLQRGHENNACKPSRQFHREKEFQKLSGTKVPLQNGEMKLQMIDSTQLQECGSH